MIYPVELYGHVCYNKKGKKMTVSRIRTLRDFYYRELVYDVVPFWLAHGIDREKGGLLDFLDRKGNPLSTDKGGWAQGRAAWMFSALYNNIEPRDEYLVAAKICADFTRDKVLAVRMVELILKSTGRADLLS